MPAWLHFALERIRFALLTLSAIILVKMAALIIGAPVLDALAPAAPGTAVAHASIR